MFKFAAGLTLHKLFAATVILFVTLSIPVTIFLLNTEQDIRQQAAVVDPGHCNDGVCSEVDPSCGTEAFRTCNACGKHLIWIYNCYGHPVSSTQLVDAEECRTSFLCPELREPTPTRTPFNGGGNNPGSSNPTITAVPINTPTVTPQQPIGGINPTPTLTQNPGTFTISGRAYLDIDESNTFTSGDVPLDGQVVRLLNGNQTTTDSEGKYEITGITPGAYRLILVFNKQNNTAEFEKNVTVSGNILYDFILKISFRTI